LQFRKSKPKREKQFQTPNQNQNQITMSSTKKSCSKSLNGEAFEIDEVVALESQT
jgi:hypothetical protein